jgi:type I restriction enzyme S subunit
MKSVFSTIRVSELVASGEVELKTGPFGTQLKANEYVEHGTPVINVRNIGFGTIKPDKLEYISPETRDRLSSHVLRCDDIVFGRKGAVERHVFIRKEQHGWFQGSDCLRLRLNSPRIHPQFASYHFLSEDHQQWMKNQCGHAATMASLNQQILERIELPIPPLPVQRRIAGILSAYDELIENSQRRIRLLEDMARALYREWFIHFRFPGNEPSPQPSPKRRGSQSAPLIPSALGDIPQGWEVTTLDQVSTKIGSGATPRGGKGAYKSEGISLIRSMNIYDYEFELADLAFIDDEQAAQLDNVTVEARDVLLNITGASVCRCSMVPSHLLPARVNQYVAIIRADTRRMDPFYLLDTINNDHNKQKLLNLAQGGATREALTKETICNFPILLPPPELLTRYGQVAGAMHAQRETLALQIQNLRRTRDLLLPRLLSGQVTLDSSLNSTHDAA